MSEVPPEVKEQPLTRNDTISFLYSKNKCTRAKMVYWLPRISIILVVGVIVTVGFIYKNTLLEIV